ncbi:MAG: helix-turn-helix transcriptional regulator [Streptosporangiaceae bacterium]
MSHHVSAAAKTGMSGSSVPQHGSTWPVGAREPKDCLSRTRRKLDAGELAQVTEVSCCAPPSGFGPAEFCEAAEVIIVRRGVFIVCQNGSDTVASPVSPLLLGAAAEYRVRHPAPAGDDCVSLLVSPSLLQDAIGRLDGRGGSLQHRDLFAVAVALRVLAGGHGDTLEAAEGALHLLAAIGCAFAEARTPRLGRAQRERVCAVQEMLASSPGRRWSLTVIAAGVHCSPFHLARQFRAATGETISAHLLRLRLALALESLAGGVDNLAALALSLGFAHHSHFSARFGRVFGLSPSAAQGVLTNARLADLRSLIADCGDIGARS